MPWDDITLRLEAFFHVHINKGLLWLNYFFVKGLKLYLLTSTTAAYHPLYGFSLLMVMFLINTRSSPSPVGKSLPKIMAYLFLLELSTWHFHDTILVALNSGRQKSTFVILEVMKFSAWISHVAVADYFCLIFDVRLPITIVEIHLLSHKIQKFLNLAFLPQVFKKTCRIGELWLVLDFARL